MRLKGWVVSELWTPRTNLLGSGPRMLLKERQEMANLVTQAGDQVYGNRAALILATASTLTAITNATTAVCTTSAAHGFGVGDKVLIAGVTPAGYNGTWSITAVGSTTTFSIYVGTALGAGSVFGTAQGLTDAVPFGMKLGTGNTAAAKTGAGAAMVTYLSGSNLAFDATYPLSSLNGSSRRIQYKTTWAAGVATNAAIAECTLSNEAVNANAASSTAQTIARVVFGSTINKGASDSLAVTWNTDLLGA
jgi:hypothetical protein